MMTAIKQGIVTVSTKEELEKIEAEKERLLSQLQPRTVQADNVTTMLPNLKKRFETLVGNMAAIPQHHIAQVREALKSLVGNHRAASVRRWCGALSDGGSDGGLRGITAVGDGQNKGGGGQGS